MRIEIDLTFTSFLGNSSEVGAPTMADLSLQCVAMKMGKMNMIINHVNGIPHIRTHKKYQKIGTSLMMTSKIL